MGLNSTWKMEQRNGTAGDNSFKIYPPQFALALSLSRFAKTGSETRDRELVQAVIEYHIRFSSSSGDVIIQFPFVIDLLFSSFPPLPFQLSEENSFLKMFHPPSDSPASSRTEIGFHC